jgi:hypothetical protein
MKNSPSFRFLVIAIMLITAISVHADKRFYDMKVSGPSVTIKGTTTTLKWVVKSKTRFDSQSLRQIDLDTRKHLKKISSRKIVKIKTEFKHNDRKSKGDPKRYFESDVWRWDCWIFYTVGGEEGRERVVTLANLVLKTNSDNAPHATAIKETIKRRQIRYPTSYKLSLAASPSKKGIVRYTERVDGFSSLWHFNRGEFVTEVIIRGPSK